LLLWAEDVSYAAIAAAVGVQATSVGSLLRRAQDAFRKAYEARYGQPS
jgi:DNA-directed RNA polymerase specialized sigma24 family protein